MLKIYHGRSDIQNILKGGGAKWGESRVSLTKINTYRVFFECSSTGALIRVRGPEFVV